MWLLFKNKIILSVKPEQEEDNILISSIGQQTSSIVYIKKIGVRNLEYKMTWKDVATLQVKTLISFLISHIPVQT